MENQVTNNANALPLFFTEDIFLVEDKNVEITHLPANESVLQDDAKEINSNDKRADVYNEEYHLPSAVVETPKINVENPGISKVNPTSNFKVEFKSLGGNKKSVLILVNDADHDVSTPEGRDLLRNIVKAVGLSTPDFALVNYAQYKGTDFTTLHGFFKPLIMLSFGVEIADLQLSYIWQNEIIIHETTRIIFAPNLHQLDGDINAKKLLWGNLKKLNA
ncbi:hypothetical protein [Pedobacter sandarakinus]|uniref:hypothetical protein n=1 Tax=Pedobacter sandarakinus TaxID=353156 RepID=UPI002247611F|nr:hypothetical protein [Pedobacter sandarakinus]MCX2573195.1 hypothetical protein [Pedobacter sandarakinus]